MAKRSAPATRRRKGTPRINARKAAAAKSALIGLFNGCEMVLFLADEMESDALLDQIVETVVEAYGRSAVSPPAAGG